MKRRIKIFLQKRNAYYKLKYSWLFRVYLHIFKPDEIAREKKEIHFYQSFLPSCDLIFDIGAHDGHKTAAFLEISQKVICCEPDKTNFSILETRFRKNKKRVFLENKAVSVSSGKAILHIHHPGSAFNTLSSQWKEILERDNMEKWSEKIQFSQEEAVETVPLDLLIKKYGKPDFIKIDVEGNEENVLRGLSQMVSFLSFEAMLPDGSETFHNCIARINDLSSGSLFNIAVNEKLLLERFVNKQELLDWLSKNPLLHLEIIAKMK